MRRVWFCWWMGFVCVLLGAGGLLWGSTWGLYGLGLGSVFIVLTGVTMCLEMRTWKHMDWF